MTAGRCRHFETRRAVLRGVPDRSAATARSSTGTTPGRSLPGGRGPAGRSIGTVTDVSGRRADRGGPAALREALPHALRAQPRRRLPLDARGPDPRLQRVLRPHLRLPLARGGPPPGGLGLLRQARGPPGGAREAARAPEPDELRALPEAQGRKPRVGPREREPDRGPRRPALRHRGHDHRHHRAQARRGAGQAPRLPRSAHEPPQPPPLQRPPHARRRPGAPPQPAAGRPLPRPRPLQGHQRLARPLGRRRAAAAGRRADPGVRPRGRHGGAPRRRRVHAARAGHHGRGGRRQDRAEDLRRDPRTRSGSTAASSS